MNFLEFTFIISCLRFQVFSQEGKSADTSFTEPGHIKSITYKTNTIRDSIVYFYEKSGIRAVFIPSGTSSRGAWIQYNKEGVKTAEWGVEENKLEGLYISYGKKGQIIRKINYVKGKLEGMSIVYYENGNVRSKVYNENNLQEGELRYYYPNGNIQWVGSYRKGKMDGERIYYDESGKPINGPFTTKDEDGKIEREGIFIDGKPEGDLKIYNSVGQLIILARFKDGKPDGATNYYGSDMIITRSELYKNGKFVGMLKVENKK
jgi:antitoxin component YwqK of YwqJK toxin-antitoxin module